MQGPAYSQHEEFTGLEYRIEREWIDSLGLYNTCSSVLWDDYANVSFEAHFQLVYVDGIYAGR